MKKRMIVMGANSAWQTTPDFPAFRKNKIRTEQSSVHPAGGRVSFRRSAMCPGEAETPQFQFSGGEADRARNSDGTFQTFLCKCSGKYRNDPSHRKESADGTHAGNRTSVVKLPLSGAPR